MTLPQATEVTTAPAESPVTVVIVDARIPMGRKVEILFEWAIAAIPVGFALALLYVLLFALLRGLRDT